MCWLTLVAAALSLGLTPVAQAASKRAEPDLTWWTSAEEQSRTVELMKEAGARGVRLNVDWNAAESWPGAYYEPYLESIDRAISLSQSAGLRVLLAVSRSPQWARNSPDREAAPDDPADFARFLRFLAARWQGRVRAYEIWNEPNIYRFWPSGPDPVAYVRLLKPAFTAIKSIDPYARVVFGGTAGNDYDFIEGAYRAGAKGYFTTMAVHPYSCDHPPEEVDYRSDGRIRKGAFPAYREVRRLMLRWADDKPIWLTEFGWSTTSAACGVSAAQQADYLTRAYTFLEQDPYVRAAYWYNFRNNWWDADFDSWETQLGLLRTDFSPKSAYWAFQAYSAP